MNNPLANETTIVRVKKKFAKSKTEDFETKGNVTASLVGMNNAIPICAEACACCWDKEIPDDYEGRAEYVAKRSRIGHTSVIEHSNYIIYLSIDKSLTNDLVKFQSWVNYANTFIEMSKDGSKWHMIIGGSFRAYCDIYKEAEDLNNPILKAITGNLYTYANSAMFEDICKYGLLEKDRFSNIEPDEHCLITDDAGVGFENDLFKIIGVDSISKILTNLHNIDEEVASLIKNSDIIKFATISILFKNMSRTCTHQLVRHRDGITQESQRYVDYTSSCFSSPALFKDRYDPNHKYTVRFGPSSQLSMTLDEIGTAMCKIYGMLNNPAIAGKEYALLKEDARAFLPSNVQCKKIYMTFTFSKFFKFLDLREDKAAQAEIRMYAQSIGDVFRENTEFSTKEIMNMYLQPKLLIEDPFKIDVDMGTSEEVVNITEEDYLKAAGLNTDDIYEEPVENSNKNLKNGDEV